MRFLVILLVIVAIGFASNTLTGKPSGVGYPLAETDDVIDSYAYNSGDVF